MHGAKVPYHVQPRDRPPDHSKWQCPTARPKNSTRARVAARFRIACSDVGRHSTRLASASQSKLACSSVEAQEGRACVSAQPSPQLQTTPRPHGRIGRDTTRSSSVQESEPALNLGLIDSTPVMRSKAKRRVRRAAGAGGGGAFAEPSQAQRIAQAHRMETAQENQPKESRRVSSPHTLEMERPPGHSTLCDLRWCQVRMPPKAGSSGEGGLSRSASDGDLARLIESECDLQSGRLKSSAEARPIASPLVCLRSRATSNESLGATRRSERSHAGPLAAHADGLLKSERRGTTAALGKPMTPVSRPPPTVLGERNV